MAQNQTPTSSSVSKRGLAVALVALMVSLPITPSGLPQAVISADASAVWSQAWAKKGSSFRSSSSSSRSWGSSSTSRSPSSSSSSSSRPFWQRPPAVPPRVPNAAATSTQRPTVTVPGSKATAGTAAPSPRPPSAPYAASTSPQSGTTGNGVRVPNAAATTTQRPTVTVPGSKTTAGTAAPSPRPPSAPSAAGPSPQAGTTSNGVRVPNAAQTTAQRPAIQTPRGGLNLNQASTTRQSQAGGGVRPTPGAQTMSGAQRTQARDRFYSKPGYQQPKASAYRSRFSGRGYGMFAGGFLASLLLSHIFDPSPSHASTWYGLSSEPEVQTFLDDARRDAEANGDTDVLARLDSLEEEMRAMQASGQPRPTAETALQQAAIPEAVAFTDTVPVAKDPIRLTMSTGGPKGVYNSLCAGTESFTGLRSAGDSYGLNVTCQNSGGGNDNLRLAALGQAQIFPVQADNLFFYKSRTGQSFGENEYVLYQEPFLMLTGKNSKIDGLSEINASSTVYVVGGAALSWSIMRDFAANDTFLGFGGNTDYARASVRKVDNLDQALEAVAADDHAVLFLVMGVQGQAIKDIDQRYGEVLRLIPVDDMRFLSLEDSNKARIYTTCDIPGGQLPNLQKGALWGTNDTQTLCTDALLVVDDHWVQTLDPDQERQVSMAVLDLLENVQSYIPRLDR